MSYLVKEYNWGLSAAIRAFAEARPPGIYKQDYLTELNKRYGDEDDVIASAPDLPDWCYSSDSAQFLGSELDSQKAAEQTDLLTDFMEEVT